jgi:mRNA interferase MazF
VRPRRLLLRGDVWQANLSPVVGYEQAGARPVIIVSSSRFNQSPSRPVVVVPATRINRHNQLHVQIEPPDGGLRYRSFALCDMVRSTASERLQLFIGRIDRSTLREIDDRLRIVLEF